MYIMTQLGWRRIQTNPFTLGEQSFANTPSNGGLHLGYHARDKESQYRELAALVVPEKYNVGINL